MPTLRILDKFVFIPIAAIDINKSQFDTDAIELVSMAGKLKKLLIKTAITKSTKNQGRVSRFVWESLKLIMVTNKKIGRRETRIILTNVAVVPVS